MRLGCPLANCTFAVGLCCSLRQRLSRLRFSVVSVVPFALLRPFVSFVRLLPVLCVRKGLQPSAVRLATLHKPNRSNRLARVLCVRSFHSFVPFVRSPRSFSRSLGDPCKRETTKRAAGADHLGDLGRKKDTKKLGDLCNLPALGVCGGELLHHSLKTCQKLCLFLCRQIAETSCSRIETFGGTCFFIFSTIAIAQI